MISSRMASDRIDISPLSPVMGAEVLGVDLSRPLDQPVRDRLCQAFLDHLLLCVRGQDLKDIGAFLDDSDGYAAPLFPGKLR